MTRTQEKGYGVRGGKGGFAGFTLIELLVVISIVGLVTAITIPALRQARQKGKDILNKNNMRQITLVANLFAADNNDRYPGSVATLGWGSGWNWHDPRTITSRFIRYFGEHRAMSEYIGEYVEDVDTMYCPNAPDKYQYIQQVWEAGDGWDCPDSLFPQDPFIGTYCFYWNYVGRLGKYGPLFVGPRRSSGGRGQSKLLVTDHLGYNQYRAEGAYGSCERFKGAISTKPKRMEEADYWHGKAGGNMPQVMLHAGYTDGHVEAYSSFDTTVMKVIIDPETGETYDDSLGMGDFFLPLNGIR